jgi:lauroyl/myristoyl acyltransferase
MIAVFIIPLTNNYRLPKDFGKAAQKILQEVNQWKKNLQHAFPHADEMS